MFLSETCALCGVLDSNLEIKMWHWLNVLTYVNSSLYSKVINSLLEFKEFWVLAIKIGPGEKSIYSVYGDHKVEAKIW